MDAADLAEMVVAEVVDELRQLGEVLTAGGSLSAACSQNRPSLQLNVREAVL